MNTDILLITPPFTQLNTPYPATPFLKGFLNSKKINCTQKDLSIDLTTCIFSRNGLTQIFDLAKSKNITDFNCKYIFAMRKRYISTIDLIISFLQNSDSTIAHRICREGFLPEASRFKELVDLELSFGSMGLNDQARYLATLYLEDIGDFIKEIITPYFGFSRYAESISIFARSFDSLYQSLQNQNCIDEMMLCILNEYIDTYKPSIIGFSIPFPGNLYAALKCSQFIKTHYKNIHITIGGGYPNTELRQLSDPRIFEFVDSITLDDGELPILKLHSYINGQISKNELVRTYMLSENNVVFYHKPTDEIKHSDTAFPDYEGLPLNKYLSVLEIANPMNRLWSDGRWNKLMVAHGCYWHKCSFCDTSLDYIKRYQPMTASDLCDRIEAVIKQTQQTGFHFVDEAAPPSQLRDLAIEIIRRNISITWWANIRFEKHFNHDLCRLLARSGCIGMSGGLEVASDRLLKKMNKGVSIEQVARVTRNFADNGIMVHAYLMYGFPTQTEQETIDSLEVVRQLFEEGCIHSAFWHKFTMTVHSPVGINPEMFDVTRINEQIGSFANNDSLHNDPKGCNHEKFGKGLKKALYNYMHNVGLEFRLQDWFDFKIPPTSLPHILISKYLSTEKPEPITGKELMFWMEELPVRNEKTNKKGQSYTIYTTNNSINFYIKKEYEIWLLNSLAQAQNTQLLFSEFENSFPFETSEFDKFIESETWNILRENGLIILK